MCEFVRYECPQIFIANRRTGETYRYRACEDAEPAGADGLNAHAEAAEA
jgi:hypothetical protein